MDIEEPEREASSSETPRSSTGMRVLQGLLLIVLLPLLFFALKPVSFSFEVVRTFPYQLDREEGFLLHQALQLTRGETIYPTLEGYPYTVGNYTPVYPALYALTLMVLEPGLAPGRAIVLAAAITIALLMALYLWRDVRQPLVMLLAPALLFCTWEFGNWLPFARVDIPALCFTMAGLLIAVHSRARWTLVIAALLFALAFFTKQTQVLAPASIFLWLLAQKRWKDSFLFAGISGGTVVLVTLILVLITGGEYWRHTVAYNENVFYWNQVGIWLRHLWLFSRWWILAVAVALAAAVLVLVRKPREWSHDTLVPLTIYLFLAALSILSIAKAGSAGNYLLEFDMVAALFVAAVLGRLLSSTSRTHMVFVSVLLLLLGAHSLRVVSHRQILFPPPPGVEARAAGDRLFLLTDSASGQVFSEDPIFPILARRPVYLQPFIMARLAIEKDLQPEEFLGDLRSGAFSLLLLSQDVEHDEVVVGLTPEMKELIASRYDLEESVPMYGRVFHVYRLKPQ